MVESNEPPTSSRYNLQYNPNPSLDPLLETSPVNRIINVELSSLRFGAEHPSMFSMNPEERASLALRGLELTGQQIEDYGLSPAELDVLVRKCFQQSAQMIILGRGTYKEAGVDVYPLKEEVTELLWKGDADISAIGITLDDLERIDREINYARAQNALIAIRWLALETGYASYRQQREDINKLRNNIYALAGRLQTSPEELGISAAELNNLQPTKKDRFIKMAKHLLSWLAGPKE